MLRTVSGMEYVLARSRSRSGGSDGSSSRSRGHSI